ncbi:hypothetical protein MKQ68_12720 [Chitinophaga horti]|uniref:Uncharacterized protein n=1 Tax=Chitinophaga horti TaxID=2920382 RepID=A0ABY6IUC0_9BACT|nr:hypothetical protein [Chitinophaga horti]UYQ90957.1 hypothetical protein MKQ68_12720 [Chitinophaga horti]
MKRLQLLLSTLVIFQAVNAQDPAYNDADKSAEAKTITLKTYGNTVSQLDKVAAIEVLSVQWDTARLGFVQVGMMNKRIDAVPALPHSIFLKQYIQQEYGSRLAASGVHVLLAVKDVRINERTFQMNEKAFCRIKADAYISNDGQQYAFVQAFDTVLVRGGMDVTGKHDEHLAKAVNLLISTSLDRGIPLLGASPTWQSKDAVQSAQLAAQQIPILQDTTYLDGVYANFDEFKANKPSVTAFKVENVKRRIRIFNDDANHTPIENPWGFCLKGELYRYTDDVAFPIEKSGHGFVISNYLQQARRRNQAMLWSAVGGGLIGGAVAQNAMKAHMVTTIPYITRQQPEATALDMETGELTL